MVDREAMKRGWEFSAKIAGADDSATMATAYVDRVAESIAKMQSAINNHTYRNLDYKQLQGYMFEEYAAGTYNTDATAAGSQDRATVLHSTEVFSVDIKTNSGIEVQAKSYADGGKSAVQQALIDPETGRAAYEGQMRIVPTDQLSDARMEAHQRVIRNKSGRPDVAAAYQDTEKNLTDVLCNDEGISSKRVSRGELNDIAKESKEGNFSPDNHGITTQSAVKEYIAKRALQAGYAAAAITTAMQLVPEIISAFDHLIHFGEISPDQLRVMGMKALSASAEGFINGAVAQAVTITFATGTMGAAMQSLDPTLIGSCVALIIGTAKNSLLVAANRMRPEEMGAQFVDSVVTSLGYFAGHAIGGIISQALLPMLPGLGYIIGSLLGTAISIAYGMAKQKLISFCVESGFTCFGLVEQDYRLPESVLRAIGIDLTQIPKLNVPAVDVPQFDIPQITVPTYDISNLCYSKRGFVCLRRGVIGLNKIGYI